MLWRSAFTCIHYLNARRPHWLCSALVAHTNTHIWTTGKRSSGQMINIVICVRVALEFRDTMEWCWCVSRTAQEKEPPADLIRNVFLWFLSMGFSVEVLTRCYVFKYYAFGAKRWTVAISATAMTVASRVRIANQIISSFQMLSFVSFQMRIMRASFANCTDFLQINIDWTHFEPSPVWQLFSNRRK